MDGWALTLLSPPNVGYASTCQTVGTSTGFFTSFTVFLALQVRGSVLGKSVSVVSLRMCCVFVGNGSVPVMPLFLQHL